MEMSRRRRTSGGSQVQELEAGAALTLTSRARVAVDDVQAIKAAADRAAARVDDLSSAVSSCNASPSSRGVEAVEVAASAVRQELIKLRMLRTSTTASPAAHRIAASQLERVAGRYVAVLSSLSATAGRDQREPPQQELQQQWQVQEGGGASALEQQHQLSDVTERNRELRAVEEGVVRINRLVQEFSVLVLSQGATLDAVDDNVAEAFGETQKAYVRLGKAARLRALIRRKKLMVGAVVAAVVIGGVILLLILVL